MAAGGATFWLGWVILLGVEEREGFIRSQYAGLIRAAYLLTGEDAAAQDLVQETLVQVVVHWRKVAGAAVPAAYVRRILLNTFLAGRRRRWGRELPWAEPPEPPEQAQDALDGVVADRDVLARALLTLPARQRAAVVLRFYDDQSEAQTAQLLGCSVGNVKSLTSRGLTALRAQLTGARP